MPLSPNKVRAALAEGRVVIGSVIYSWSPNVMEVAGYAGLDFMRVDLEHSWRRDTSLEELMRAAEISGVEAVVRVEKDDPQMIRRVLETGASGIIAPCDPDVEAVEKAVEAARFPPRGTRGYSGNCRSAAWGTRAGAEWVEWSDSEPMIGVMIEDAQAIECIDEMLAVDGLDFVLFGPADYSMSLGFRRPAKNSDEVQEALAKTVAAAKKSGKHVMLGVGNDMDEIVRYAEMGVTMLETGNDCRTLGAFWRDLAAGILDRTGGRKKER